jgi:hypothetical protein
MRGTERCLRPRSGEVSLKRAVYERSPTTISRRRITRTTCPRCEQNVSRSLLCITGSRSEAWSTGYPPVSRLERVIEDGRRVLAPLMLTNDNIVQSTSPRRPRVLMTNGGPVDAVDVEVEIIPHAEHPGIVVGLLDDAGEPNEQLSLGALRVGESRELLVAEDSKLRGGELRLRVTYTTDVGPATSVASCKVPGYARVWSV